MSNKLIKPPKGGWGPEGAININIRFPKPPHFVQTNIGRMMIGEFTDEALLHFAKVWLDELMTTAHTQRKTGLEAWRPLNIDR